MKGPTGRDPGACLARQENEARSDPIRVVYFGPNFLGAPPGKGAPLISSLDPKLMVSILAAIVYSDSEFLNIITNEACDPNLFV